MRTRLPTFRPLWAAVLLAVACGDEQGTALPPAGPPAAEPVSGAIFCQELVDCPLGHECRDGVCEPFVSQAPGLCANDSQCPPGSACEVATGLCRELAPPPESSSDPRVGAEPVCTDGAVRHCGVSKIGRCRWGVEDCVAGSWTAVCEGSVDPMPEQCNGVDDDCDGVVPAREQDRDGDGQRVCEGDCDDGDTAVYRGATESCDGKDNECDGATDEGLVRACGLQDGVCSGAESVCAAGTWLACNYGGAHQTDETVCDGLDNDCDAATDEGLSRVCPLQLGVCAGASAACAGGAFAACEYGSAFEGQETSCDGLDNDCDGLTDEQLSLACPLQAGVCVSTASSCTAGQWSVCDYGSAFSEPEALCDGLDNDCDGAIDESLARACPLAAGVCAGSQSVCAAGDYAACDYGARYQSAESACDALDNDCDGATDEGLSLVCALQLGVCAGSRSLCAGGAYRACDYGPSHQTAETLCDGLDNDCDGLTDEVLARACPLQAGVCAAASSVCAGGAWSACDYGPQHQLPETACDARDNDCDGVTDELLYRECPLRAGVCASAISSCSAGAWSVCDYGAGFDELESTCEGLDNDCDGLTDEYVAPQLCALQSGVCAGSVAVCAAGRFGDCSSDNYGPLFEAPERSCDNRDNDCDGTADEDLATFRSLDSRVSDAGSQSDFVHVAYAGELGTVGMAWADRRDGNWEIYYAALDKFGRRLTPSGNVRLTSQSALSSYPSMAWNGSDFGLVWADSRQDNRELWFTRVLPSGLRPPGVVDKRITFAARDSDWPAMIWNGAGYAMAWTDNRNPDNTDPTKSQTDVYFALLDAAGTPTREVRVGDAHDASQGSPQVGWNGTRYGLVYHDERYATSAGFPEGQIFFQRVEADGTLGTPVRLTVPDAGQPVKDASWPDIDWDGQAWAIVWHDSRAGGTEVWFARVDEDGQFLVRPTRLTVSSGTASFASLDWTGSYHGVSWKDSRDGNPEIYFALVSQQGVKTSQDLRITNDPALSDFTSVVWTGVHFGFSWRDMRHAIAPNTNNSEIYYAYVGCAGADTGSDAWTDPGAGTIDSGSDAWSDAPPPPDAGSDPPGTAAFTLATWNVRNFFDERNDPRKDDLVFTAAEVNEKIRRLGEVLVPLAPDIVALQEVENLALLERLADTSLAPLGLTQRRLVEAYDPRGIDVALLTRYPVTRTLSHTGESFYAPDGSGPYGYSRDCLEVHLDVEGRAVVVLVNHQISRLFAGMEPKRQAQAAHTRQIADRLRAEDPRRRVLIVGDMNDDPGDPSTQIYSSDGGWIDVGLDVPAADRWTLYYQRAKYRFDYIFPDLDTATYRLSVEIPHWPAVGDVSDHAPVVSTFLLP